MTRKEALKSAVGFAVDDTVLDRALIDGGFLIDSDEDYDEDQDRYTKEISKEIDLCAIAVLDTLLSTPDVSEGGYQVTFDRAAIKQRIEALSVKHGITSNTSPQIKDASNKW